MRKKTRNVSVDGTNYSWAVEERLWPSCVLRVWRKKGDVWFEMEFSAPDGPVTPQTVVDQIRSRLIANTQ